LRRDATAVAALPAEFDLLQRAATAGTGGKRKRV
jgi:hypothetical protein